MIVSLASNRDIIQIVIDVSNPFHARVRPHPSKCDFTIDLIRMPVGVTTCSGNYFDVKEVNSLVLMLVLVPSTNLSVSAVLPQLKQEI